MDNRIEKKMLLKIKNRVILYLTGISVVLILIFGACSRRISEEPELRIGIIAPVTGKMDNLGASVLEGAQLAVEEQNADGGIQIQNTRYSVVTIIKDSEDKPELAVAAAQELINQEGVSVIIGPPMSGLAIPVAQVASRAFVPMITQSATHPDVTRGTRCVYRACFTDDLQGKIMARFARAELGARRVAVLYDIASPYNSRIAEIFMQSFKENGGELVLSETYTTREDSFIDQLIRIRKFDPDVLFLPNYFYDIILQIEQIQELAISTQIIGSDTMSFRDPEDIPYIEGAYFSTHFSSEIPSQKVKQFVTAYQSAFGRIPSAAGALTYDAFGLLNHAIKAQNSIDPKLICKGLSEIEGYEGITGMISFHGSPDPEKSTVIIHVHDGRFHFHTQFTP
jgi:branched-chain amino acid transport system substrate-binding protein